MGVCCFQYEIALLHFLDISLSLLAKNAFLGPSRFVLFSFRHVRNDLAGPSETRN